MRAFEFTFAAKQTARSEGRSSVAAAAYRTGSILYDERTGLTHDYTKKGGVEHSQIYLPDNAPERLRNAQTQHDLRQKLWNAAEAKENRSNSITSREFIVSLPHEFNAMQRREAGDAIARNIMGRFGVAVEIAYHKPTGDADERNFHAHIMYAGRAFDDHRSDGWAKNRYRDMNKDTVTLEDGTKTPRNAITIKELRAHAAAEMNRIAERDKIEVRTENLSFKERGIDREPSQHLGAVAHDMEKRSKRSERGDVNREIEAVNDNREALETHQKISQLDKEREKRGLPDVSMLAAVRAHPHYTTYAQSVASRESELQDAQSRLERLTFAQKLFGKRRELLDEIEARELNLADARQRLDDLTQSVRVKTEPETVEIIAARSKRQAETAAREAAEREKQAEQYGRNQKELSALTDVLASRTTTQRVLGAITGKTAEVRSRIAELTEQVKSYEAQKRQEDAFHAGRNREQVEDHVKRKNEQRGRDHLRSVTKDGLSAEGSSASAQGGGRQSDEAIQIKREEERRRLQADMDAAQAAADSGRAEVKPAMSPEEKRAASIERFNQWVNDKAEEQDNAPNEGLDYD